MREFLCFSSKTSDIMNPLSVALSLAANWGAVSMYQALFCEGLNLFYWVNAEKQSSARVQQKHILCTNGYEIEKEDDDIWPF